MRKIGKIVEFDGCSGELVDKDGKIHVFTKDDLTGGTVETGDVVQFDSELFKTVEIEMLVARFVKKK